MLKNLTRLVPGKRWGDKAKNEWAQKENATANHPHARSGVSCDAKMPAPKGYICNNVRDYFPRSGPRGRPGALPPPPSLPLPLSPLGVCLHA